MYILSQISVHSCQPTATIEMKWLANGDVGRRGQPTRTMKHAVDREITSWTMSSVLLPWSAVMWCDAHPAIIPDERTYRSPMMMPAALINGSFRSPTATLVGQETNHSPPPSTTGRWMWHSSVINYAQEGAGLRWTEPPHTSLSSIVMQRICLSVRDARTDNQSCMCECLLPFCRLALARSFVPQHLIPETFTC